MSTMETNKENFARWSAKLYDDLVTMGINIDDDRIYLCVRSSIAAFLKDNIKPMIKRLLHEVQKVRG